MTRQEYYEKYDDHVKLNLEQKHMLEHLVDGVVALLRDARISGRPGAKPMSDVQTLHICFPADGVFRGFGLAIAPYGSCYISVAMEPEPGEEESQEHVMNEEGRTRTP